MQNQQIGDDQGEVGCTTPCTCPALHLDLPPKATEKWMARIRINMICMYSFKAHLWGYGWITLCTKYWCEWTYALDPGKINNSGFAMSMFLNNLIHLCISGWLCGDWWISKNMHKWLTATTRVSFQFPLTFSYLWYQGIGVLVVFHESMCPYKTGSQDNTLSQLWSQEWMDGKFAIISSRWASPFLFEVS